LRNLETTTRKIGESRCKTHQKKKKAGTTTAASKSKEKETWKVGEKMKLTTTKAVTP